MKTLALLLMAFPAIASANLMTFETLDRSIPQTQIYVEDGISATGKFYNGRTDQWAPVDRDGHAGRWIDFTTGGVFTAESVMIRPGGSGYCISGGCAPDWDPIDYIWISGFFEDTLVSSVGLYRQSSLDWELFDLTFLGPIDMLRLEARTYYDLGLTGWCNFQAGCGHFDVDNVILTPSVQLLAAIETTSVPEPATLALFGAGLLGMLAARRRGKKAPR